MIIDGWQVRDGLSGQDWAIVREVHDGDPYGVRRWPLPERPVVLDVGACIGAFARLVLDLRPGATVLAVEVNPRNWETLRANAPGAIVVPKALHYGPAEDLALLDTVYPGTPTTGGSTVLTRAEVRACTDPQYHKDFSPIATCTVESLLAEHGLDRIDLVKLDCEGSEYSLFAHLTREAAARIGVFVGEYHGGHEPFCAAVRAFSGRVAITYRFETWAPHGHMGLFRALTHEVHARPGS